MTRKQAVEMIHAMTSPARVKVAPTGSSGYTERRLAIRPPPMNWDVSSVHFGHRDPEFYSRQPALTPHQRGMLGEEAASRLASAAGIAADDEVGWSATVYPREAPQ